ncbi:MAG: hypothetical protein AAF668_04635 [Pseudomonadota bacterium]
MTGKHLGYSAEEKQTSPYTAFFNPQLEPLQRQVVEGLQAGGQAHELFPTIEHAPSLLQPGYWPVETGYARTPDMGIRVFCLTHMPDVAPEMWDWWFGWHGCEAQRYKLWHPKAHIDAKWADGRSDEQYIGRTSLITEYLGSERKNAAITFLPPAKMGLDESRLLAQREVAICARVGMPHTPLKAGYLLHHLRPTEDGCEMRSRMWFGGNNASIGDRPNAVSRGVLAALRPATKFLLPNPAELLVHNAQEMAHLAGFLPQLYEAFGPASKKAAA